MTFKLSDHIKENQNKEILTVSLQRIIDPSKLEKYIVPNGKPVFTYNTKEERFGRTFRHGVINRLPHIIYVSAINIKSAKAKLLFAINKINSHEKK